MTALRWGVTIRGERCWEAIAQDRRLSSRTAGVCEAKWHQLRLRSAELKQRSTEAALAASDKDGACEAGAAKASGGGGPADSATVSITTHSDNAPTTGSENGPTGSQGDGQTAADGGSDGDGASQDQNLGPKKRTRISWWPELHAAFERAVAETGGIASEDCTPARIWEIMGNTSLTRTQARGPASARLSLLSLRGLVLPRGGDLPAAAAKRCCRVWACVCFASAEGRCGVAGKLALAVAHAQRAPRSQAAAWLRGGGGPLSRRRVQHASSTAEGGPRRHRHTEAAKQKIPPRANTDREKTVTK